MTEREINGAIFLGFSQIYAHHFSTFDITRPEEDRITVEIGFPDAPARTYDCEVVSDDDGYFHFHLRHTPVPVTVLIRYPQ